MGYIPPPSNQVDSELKTGYTAPPSDQVDSNLDEGDGGKVYAHSYLLQGYSNTLVDYTAQGYADSLLVSIVQEYGDALFAYVSQVYEDAAQLTAYINQYYKDRPVLNNYTDQGYDDARALFNTVVQECGLPFALHSFVEAIYNIAGQVNVSYVGQGYDLRALNAVASSVLQGYDLAPEGLLHMQDNTVVIGGVSVACSSLQGEFNQNAYVGSLDVSLVDRGQWETVDFEDEVVVTVGPDVYHFVVVSKNKSETVKGITLNATCKSKGIYLDFPYASPVSDDFTYGMASDMVARLGLLEGLVISWDLPVDWPLTASAAPVEGLSPLEAIRLIVWSVKALLQSNPDGTLYVGRIRTADSDKLYSAPAQYTLNEGEQFISTGTTPVKNSGYNAYEVSAVSSESTRYTMKSEEVSSTEMIVKVFEVPWSTNPVSLETSDIDLSVTIVRLDDVVNEETCEEVEIVEGEGTLSNPYYGLQSISYADRENLGDLSISEDGEFTCEILGESIVKVGYYTKYKVWRVTSADIEKVQLILRS